MSETKHTPGPWFAYLSETGRWTVQHAGGWIAELFDAPARPAEANARVMAAAPELLEALKAEHSSCPGYVLEDGGLEMQAEKPCPICALIVRADASHPGYGWAPGSGK